MNTRTSVLRALGSLALLTGCGVVGFVAMEGMSWLDALYLSVITISTVGYGDVVPVTPQGRLFAVALIVFGVGITLYLVSLVAGEVFEGRLRDVYHRRTMMREIRKLNGHVIVCGFGRYGRVVVEELVRAGREVVVIDTDPNCVSGLDSMDVAYIIGSAVDDEVLEGAGISRADALVVGISSGAESVFITLSARELNSEIRIHGRGESDVAVRRLRRAGADFVSSPYQMGGIRTATTIIRPSVVDFLELSLPNREEEAIDLEEVHVDEGSELAGLEISRIEAQGSKLRIVALKRGAEAIELVPAPNMEVEVADHLVVIGEREGLSSLAQRALGDTA